MIVKVCLIISMCFLVSCGSRKVDLQKRITDIEHNLSVKIKELEIERNKLRVYESSRIVKADSVVEKDGKRTIYNPRSEERSAEKEEISEVERTKEEEVNEGFNDKSSEVDKKVDRKQFDWWYILVSILFLALTIGIVVMYRKRF